MRQRNIAKNGEYLPISRGREAASLSCNEISYARRMSHCLRLSYPRLRSSPHQPVVGYENLTMGDEKLTIPSYCGNSIQNGGAPATDGRCSMACSGAKSEICGGANGLTMWQFNTSSVPVQSSASASPTTTTTAAPSPTSGVNATAILPWKYAGCYTDNSQGGRALAAQQPDSKTLTVESCIATCSSLGYSVSGVEYGVQCFCSGKNGQGLVYNNPSLVDDSQCNMACSGNSYEKCGAGGRLSIYSNATLTNYTAPTAQKTGLPSGWNYGGCLSDPQGGRALPYLSEYQNNTNTQCISLCQKYGYNAAGTQYGIQCFCGDVQNTITAGATFVDESKCNIKCANDTNTQTGGFNCGGLGVSNFYTFNGESKIHLQSNDGEPG